MHSPEIYLAKPNPHLPGPKKPHSIVSEMALMIVLIWLGWKSWWSGHLSLLEIWCILGGTYAPHGIAYALWDEKSLKVLPGHGQRSHMTVNPATRVMQWPGINDTHSKVPRYLAMIYVFTFSMSCSGGSGWASLWLLRGYISKLAESEQNTWRSQARLFVYRNEH